MASICTSNVTSGFIDLATFDEIEKYLYGGPDATAYFVRETRKSTWFTQVPVVLSRASGTADFGQEWSVSISRAGDYLLQTWLRVVLDEVKPKFDALDPKSGVGWTKNLMHNLIRECCITFNDLVAARFDNYHLDFWSAFTTPAGKNNGYQNMIGNYGDLINPRNGVGVNGNIPSAVLNLPLPFFYGSDSGVALPTAALPYNDMRIQFSFRNWQDLLCKYTEADEGGNPSKQESSSMNDLLEPPKIKSANVWANYAIVSNDERKRMACAPRDILIEQVQTAPRQAFKKQANQSYDIRFSHAIKVLFFAVRNTSACWSNYTTNLPDVTIGEEGEPGTLDFSLSEDPISTTSLIYENTNRLANMGSDYFALVNPWYHAPVIPQETGYHMYSYSLDFICLDPMGSTNYGKLTNVSIVPEPNETGLSSQSDNTYEFVVTAVNNNIIRVSGGALGFPVL